MAYVKSKYIKIYPTAYRGLSSDSQKVYDPESRMLTEKNVSNIYKNIIDRSFNSAYSKGSYLITDCNNINDLKAAAEVEFILGGYYFKLINHADNHIWDAFDNRSCYVAIKTAKGISADDSNTSFENERLVNFEAGTTDLDVGDEFKALSFVDTKPITDTIYLQLLDSEGNVPSVSKFKVNYKNVFAGSELEGGLDHFLKTDVINFQDKIFCPLGKKDPQLSANEVENIELNAVDLSIRTPELHNKRDNENKGTGKLLIDAPDEITINTKTDNKNSIILNNNEIVAKVLRNSSDYEETNSVSLSTTRTTIKSATGNLDLKSGHKINLDTWFNENEENSITLDAYGRINFTTAYNAEKVKSDVDEKISFTLPYGKLDRLEPKNANPNILATRDWLDSNIYLNGDKIFRGNITVGQSDGESAKSKNIDLYANILRLGSAYGDLSIPRLKYINNGYTYSEASLDIQDTDVKIYTSKRNNADNSFRIVNKNNASILSVYNKPQVWFGSPGYSVKVPVEMYGALNVYLKDGKGLKVNYDPLTGAVDESSGVVLNNVNFKQYLDSNFNICKKTTTGEVTLLNITTDSTTTNTETILNSGDIQIKNSNGGATVVSLKSNLGSSTGCQLILGNQKSGRAVSTTNNYAKLYLDSFSIYSPQRTARDSTVYEYANAVSMYTTTNGNVQIPNVAEQNQVVISLGSVKRSVHPTLYLSSGLYGGLRLKSVYNDTTGTILDGASIYSRRIYAGQENESTPSTALTVWGNASITNICSANEFNATSDARLKENLVEYISDKSILSLPVYKYNFINDSKKEKHIGVLAQDLQKYCPEIVHENEEGYLSIEESKIVYLLLNDVKKLEKRIQELEKKLK